MSNNPNWKTTLQALINRHNHRHAKRHKDVADRTKAARAGALFVMFKQLRDLGFQLDPEHLDGNHVKHLVWYWTCDSHIEVRCRQHGMSMLPQPHSPAYLQSLVSTLRTFAQWIGKPGLVQPLKRYGVDPALFARTYVALEDKGWESHGIDIAQLLQRVACIDERVAIMLELVWRAGLRRKEAVMFQPGLAVRPAGLMPIDHPVADQYVACLSVHRGTKGGRLRLIPLVSDVQRDAIVRAKKYVAFPAAYLGHPHMTLLQALDRYKNVLSKAGITKKVLGVTGHGLRHQFAGDKFFDLAGVACPVRGGDPLHDPELLERVLRAVSQQLGHNRTQITHGYCGSAASMTKTGRPVDPEKDSA